MLLGIKAGNRCHSFTNHVLKALGYSVNTGLLDEGKENLTSQWTSVPCHVEDPADKLKLENVKGLVATCQRRGMGPQAANQQLNAVLIKFSSFAC